MIRVGIVGGTGYTGAELLRILAQHPEAQAEVITSRGDEGKRVADVFPNLRGHCTLTFTAPDVAALANCDVVFFATPHGVAQAMMPELIGRGIRVIDLSADFRIRDIKTWEQWYNQPHGCPELVPQAVYGLPELNRKKIKTAQLVACPGCYPTAVELGYLPLLEQGLIDPTRLIANSASGVSGAGRQASVDNLLTEVNESFKAYGVNGHRHLPEIEQGLRDIQAAAQQPESALVTFVPHLLPLVRGIHATLYGTLLRTDVDLQALYEHRFADEPFVDVLPPGVTPQTRTVKGTNTCRIAVARPQNRDTVVVLVAEDNLTKGASGQAIQCMNIMFGLEETYGLTAPALFP